MLAGEPIALAAMRLPPHEHKQDNHSPWEQLKTGLDYVRHQPNLRALLILALAFSVFGISYSTVLPAFIDKALHMDATAFGTINAMTGVGAVTGAFLIATYGNRGFRGRWLNWAILLFPVVLTAFSLVHYYPVNLFLAILLGIGFMTTYTLINTLLQTTVMDEMRGRVMSLYTLTFFGFTPFGNLAIGSLSEWIGLTSTLVISAILCFVTAALLFWWTPSIRKLP